MTRSGQHFDFGTAKLNIKQITMLQSIVRGFLERRRYRVLSTRIQATNGVYFKREELFETLENKN